MNFNGESVVEYVTQVMLEFGVLLKEYHDLYEVEGSDKENYEDF